MRWPCLACLVTVGFTGVLAKCTSQEAAAKQTLRALAAAYLNNRESFRSFECKYRITAGKASSIQDALLGRFADIRTAECLWIVNGSKTRLECSEPGVDKRTGSEPFLVTKVLRSGEFQLRYLPGISVASINGLRTPDNGLDMTPFDMGVIGEDESGSPPRMIKKWLSEGYAGFSSDRLAEHKDAVGICYGPSLVNWRSKVFLDVDKGCFPIQLWGKGGKKNEIVCKVFVTSMIPCSRGRWFPERSVLVWLPEDAPPLETREIKVLSLTNLNSPPPDERFAITIPKGTYVNDRANPASQFSLTNDEVVALKDMGRLYDRTQQALKARAEVEGH